MHNLKEKIMGIIELIKSNKQLKQFIVMHNLKEKIMGIIELIKSNKQLKRFIVSLVVIIAVIFCFLSSCSSSSSNASYMNKIAKNLVEEIADGNVSNVQKLLNNYKDPSIKHDVNRIRIETALYGGIYSAEASKQIEYYGDNEVHAKEAFVRIRVLFKKKGLYASHCAELGHVTFHKNEAGEWYPICVRFEPGRIEEFFQESVDEGFLDSVEKEVFLKNTEDTED